MALQTVKRGFVFPAWPPGLNGLPGAGTLVLDASGEKVALIFMATAAKAIHKVHFRTFTVTTGGTVDVRVETVDSAANGDPTGTLWATNTNAAVVVADGDDDVWKTATLTADATVAVGDVVALVVVAGSPGNMQIVTGADNISGFPYGSFFTASWAKQFVNPLIVAEYSDGSFEPMLGWEDPGHPVTGTAFASNSATNRRGNIFQLAFPARATGCWLLVDADGDFTVTLYDSDGSSVLAVTPTINHFQRSLTSGVIAFYPFLAPATLAAATNYRLAVVPTTTTSIAGYEFAVVSAAMLDMFAGGQSCHRSVFTSSAWVETTTARTYVGLFLDQFSDGVGGGLLRHPGMTGGMHG